MPDIKDPRFVSSMFPLIATQGSVGFDSIGRDEVKKLINSHLKMLLLTAPGEIISDARFGVGLFSYLFLLETEGKLQNLKQAITNQIIEYLPYLKNFRVLVDSTQIDSHRLAVRIEYTITNDLTKDTIDFVVDESSATIYFADGGSPAVPSILSDILAGRS